MSSFILNNPDNELIDLSYLSGKIFRNLKDEFNSLESIISLQYAKRHAFRGIVDDVTHQEEASRRLSLFVDRIGAREQLKQIKKAKQELNTSCLTFLQFVMRSVEDGKELDDLQSKVKQYEEECRTHFVLVDTFKKQLCEELSRLNKRLSQEKYEEILNQCTIAVDSEESSKLIERIKLVHQIFNKIDQLGEVIQSQLRTTMLNVIHPGLNSNYGWRIGLFDRVNGLDDVVRAVEQLMIRIDVSESTKRLFFNTVNRALNTQYMSAMDAHIHKLEESKQKLEASLDIERQRRIQAESDVAALRRQFLFRRSVKAEPKQFETSENKGTNTKNLSAEPKPIQSHFSQQSSKNSIKTASFKFFKTHSPEIRLEHKFHPH